MATHDQLPHDKTLANRGAASSPLAPLFQFFHEQYMIIVIKNNIFRRNMGDEDHHQHHSQPHDDNHNSQNHSMGMDMTFHFGTMVTILFDFWQINSATGIFFSSIVIIFACFCMEFIRWYRVYRKKELVAASRSRESSSAEFNGNGISLFKRLNKSAFFDAGMHAIQLTISYMLMLIFMTFNVWLCMAVIVGEVLARLTLSLLFPHLDLFVSFFGAASAEPCCG